MDKMPAKELLEKYVTGKCTKEEEALVLQWYSEISKPAASEQPNRFSFISGAKKASQSMIWKVAAVTLIAVAISIVFINIKMQPNKEPVTESVVPGTNAAILTFANGKRINLNNLPAGVSVTSNGTTIHKTDGQIVYEPTTGHSNDVNTITTPKGGQFRVVLPDGTKVFLNAGSKLTYPLTLNGNERIVELNGEAYFEVAKDKTRPFLVKSFEQLITVTGTHFNVCCYISEPTITTLLEGGVTVTQKGTNLSRKLTPGQQAVLNQNNINIKPVDVNDAVAWKSGLFVFTGTSLQVALNQIARWYAVEVPDNLPPISIDGEIPRTAQIEDVITLLERTTNIHFTLENRRIIMH